MADGLANFFFDKVTKMKESLPRVNRDPLETLRKAYEKWIPLGGMPNFKLESITNRDIEKIISKMKNSHSFGRDRVDAITIKLAAPILIPVLTHVVNLSLGTGKFPAKWKLARILPLLEKQGK